MSKLALGLAAVLALTAVVGVASAQSSRRGKPAEEPKPPAACMEAAPQGFRTVEACKARGSNAAFTWQVAADSGCECAVDDKTLTCKVNGAGTVTVGVQGVWKTFYAGRDHSISVASTGPQDIRCTPAALVAQ